ncbi:phage portal protein, partial [Escherichia coli]|nr:phage portal protein [Escherichia coli]
MSRKKQKFQARPQPGASEQTAGIESFSFGDPVAIT